MEMKKINFDAVFVLLFAIFIKIKGAEATRKQKINFFCCLLSLKTWHVRSIDDELLDCHKYREILHSSIAIEDCASRFFHLFSHLTI